MVLYFRTFLGVHTSRLRQAMRAGDRGASAIELAVITAVLVALAITILVIIQKFVDTQDTNIGNQKPPAGT
jgi:hypothetical protein